MSHLDPLAAHSLSFLFPRCQARLDGADLVVAVPAPGVTCRAASGAELAWAAPHPVSAAVTIECQPGAHQRSDRSEYPTSPAYAQSVEFRFRGAVWYGRVPLRDGWALCVQGAVRSLAGLPLAWLREDAVLVEPPELSGAPQRAASVGIHFSDGGGPVNGPHLPYP